MELISQIEKVQGQALDTLAVSQERLLEVNGKVAGAVKERVPAVKVPFIATLPTPADGVKLYFDFVGKLHATNRKFAERAVAAWVDAPKAAKATAPKAAAPKATAPKAAAAKATRARVAAKA